MFRMPEELMTILRHLSPFRRQPPIADTSVYVDFLASRSSYVAQKKLLEYVKQRMGASYPKHFENDEFIASLRIAQWRVYAACLSDLSLWMSAQLINSGAQPDEARAIAGLSHRSVIDDRFEDDVFGVDRHTLQTEFEARAALCDWPKLAGANFDVFERSSQELVRWAPIADQLKRYDREIVFNSLRFAWMDVREQYRKKLDAAQTLAHWRLHLAENDQAARPAI